MYSKSPTYVFVKRLYVLSMHFYAYVHTTHTYRKCTEKCMCIHGGGVVERRKIFLSILYLLTFFSMSMFYLYDK